MPATDFLLPPVEASFLFTIGDSDESIGEVALGVFGLEVVADM